MSRNINYIFPPSNQSDVSVSNGVNVNGFLPLNGNLANPITNQVSFISYGYSRSVSITSTQNLSARTFTITGIQNGVPVTENITGPNNTTVYGIKNYDIITSSFVNGNLGTQKNWSIGTGVLGFFPLIQINLERPIINYTLTISALTPNFIPTNLYGTIQNISQNGLPFLQNIATVNFNVFDLTASIPPGFVNQYYYSSNINGAFGYLLIAINGTTATNLNDSLQLIFMQV